MRFSFILTLLFATPALAQTMIYQQEGINAPPIPAGSVEQAKRQLKGDFDNLARPDYGTWVGGQIQKAWSKSGEREGIFVYRACPKEACVYKLRAREWMVSSIILPKDTEIEGFDIGDPAGFQVRQRANNILAVQPARGGMDTSLQVYTRSGEVYSFYIRAESFNSKNIPDLVVRINDWPTLPETPMIRKNLPHPGKVIPMTDNCGGGHDFGGGVIPDNCGNHQEHKTGNRHKDQHEDHHQKPEDHHERSNLQTNNPSDFHDLTVAAEEEKQQEKDFIQSVPFNPGRLHGWDDYELWGSDDSRKLRPERVFRDDIFTYIQFGDHWDGIDLPTAYVVVDGLDELVNTRIDGHTFIVESTARLITLKSGETYLCIKYVGEEA